MIAHPVYVVVILFYSVNGRVPIDRPWLSIMFETIADASATYFISVTILVLTLMSVEPWMQHMSRRTLVTSLHVCLSATVFFVIPTPLVVFRSLETINRGSIGRGLYILNMTIMQFCLKFYKLFEVSNYK